MRDTTARKGLVLAFSGALLLSFDTLLLRMVSAEPVQMAFWRGALMAVAGLGAGLLLRRHGKIGLDLVHDGSGLMAAALYGSASVCFVASAMLTNIANMLVIVATAPLWAAIGAALFLKERTPSGTWLACAAAFFGIVLVVWPGLSEGANVGDVIALLTAICMAGAFVLSRRSRANLALAPATGGLLSAIALSPFVQDFSFARSDQVLWMVLEGAMLVPLALGLIAVAPRYLPAPQVGLFLLLETVLGPFWVWTALGEEPTIHVLVGGTVVVLTLFVHSAFALRTLHDSAGRLAS